MKKLGFFFAVSLGCLIAPRSMSYCWAGGPSSVHTLTTEAIAAYQTGNYGPAATYFEDILKLQPNNAFAWYFDGQSLRQMGNPRAARTSYLQAIAISGASSDLGVAAQKRLDHLFTAVAIAWNSNSGYAVRGGTTLGEAQNAAMQNCGGCNLSPTTLSANAFGCLAIVKCDDGQLHSNSSTTTAYDAVSNASQSESNCTLVFSYCNDAPFPSG